MADLVTVTLPWGSLLRGALALDDRVAAGIAGLVATGGRVDMLLAPAARDRLAPDVDAARRGSSTGSSTTGERSASRSSPPGPRPTSGSPPAHSTWAKRLGLRAGDADRAAHAIVLARRR